MESYLFAMNKVKRVSINKEIIIQDKLKSQFFILWWCRRKEILKRYKFVCKKLNKMMNDWMNSILTNDSLINLQNENKVLFEQFQCE